MILTEKQLHIMSVIMKGNDDGSFVDLDQILERIPYETTKQSIQFSIRALIERQLINKKPHEKRRGRRRVVLGPTELAFFVMRSGPREVYG